MDQTKLIQSYPYLYHMAEKNTWPSIRQNGLWSTTAVLDELGIPDAERSIYESTHRPAKVVLSGNGKMVTLRDQKPMPRQRLLAALPARLAPEDWYRLINRKVFLWASSERLSRLLCAKDYRNLEHDVLTIDSKSFIEAYAEAIELCHMNSGNTFPYPHVRDERIFRSISDYPSKKNGSPLEPVAELVVDYCVPDISKFVVKVERIRGEEVLRQIL